MSQSQLVHRGQTLARMAWPQVTNTAGSVLVVPLGATEQHGPHLPLGTDTVVARAVCGKLAQERTDVVVAPALPFGSSGEHAAFPGTLSIGQSALEALLVELVRSADHFSGTVLVSGHGGNAEPLARAVATSRRDDRRVLAWWPSNEMVADLIEPEVLRADAHAGRIETSLMMHLCPETVAGPSADYLPGTTRPVTEIAVRLRDHGVAAVSSSGVLGNPACASAEEGRAVLDAFVRDLDGRISQWLKETK